MKTLEEEAKKFQDTNYLPYDKDIFIAGANSKWVRAEKIKAQIEILNEIRGGFNTDNRFYIDYKIEQLEQQLKELENENT